MAKPIYYQLEIKRISRDNPDSPWEIVWSRCKPVKLRDILSIIPAKVYSGEAYHYMVDVWRKDEPFPVATLTGASGYIPDYQPDIPISLKNSFDCVAARLNADMLWKYRAEMQWIFENRENYPGIFRIKTAGSDYGYVGVNKQEIAIKHLANDTVVKVGTRWTHRFKHVTTWQATNPAELVELCVARNLALEV